MKKIRDLYIDSDKDGHNFVVLEAEDGTLYKQEDVATGNCWMLYWADQSSTKTRDELARLILEINTAQVKKVYSIGDVVNFEQCWEDETGNYHDESAEIEFIGKEGELTLTWLVDDPKLKNFLNDQSYNLEDIK